MFGGGGDGYYEVIDIPMSMILDERLLPLSVADGAHHIRNIVDLWTLLALDSLYPPSFRTWWLVYGRR